MAHKVVDHPKKAEAPVRLPVSDFWFAQLDVRLGKIEFMLSRLEWQVWVIVCAVFAVFTLEIITAIAAQ